MTFTREKVKMLLKQWHFIQIHLRRGDVSVVALGGRPSEPSNPTLSKAQQLAALDEYPGQSATGGAR